MNHTLDIYLDDLKYLMLNNYPEHYARILQNDYYIRGQIADLMGFRYNRVNAYLNISQRLELMAQMLGQEYSPLISQIASLLETSLND